MDANPTEPRLVRWNEDTVLENVRAVASAHSFPRHVHAQWVVGLVTRGAKEFDLNGRLFLAGPGSIFSIPPGEAHCGRAADGSSAHYSAWFFPPQSFLRSRQLLIPASIHQCAGLTKIFKCFENAVAVDPQGLASQSWLEHLRSRLGPDAAETRGPRLSAIADPLRKATDFIHANAFRSISLKELAHLEGLSRYHLLRKFKQAHGLPPHAYQDALRIERAKHLLLRGSAIADTAQAVGYSDQAHFTRRMKRLNGYTPGQFVRARQ